VDVSELRFLVVEDHGFQRWFMGNLLQSLGAKYILSAADGQAALDIFRNYDQPIDIIVSDLDMPGMDGMAFIRHLGEIGTAVSLIVASSMDRAVVATVETMAKAYGVELLGTIDKPATAKKLRAVIDLYRAAGGEPKRPAITRTNMFTLEEILEGLKREEFEPFFQPKMDMRSSEARSAEAIARWRHPREGIVGPQAFVRLLEENGEIGRLTAIMLRKSVASCRFWQDAGHDVSLSINLSLDSLADVDLADRMMQVVYSQGLEPRHVIFEVTESAMAADLGRALENLSRLRMKGFGLSIDDYGTGYSSMQQLTQIPFTELKIDQSFVKNAATKPSSRAMLESSLEMARKLDIVAVAEGVESQVEWDLLRELGCQQAQGYYIARPMEAGEFIEWLRIKRIGA
jgi:EAL domain-containing protein (putative c-di-GMP-specific phosphodiesterase class I)/CheY-like chemotaxis protein